MNKFYTLLTVFTIIIFTTETSAQITLNNSPYSENFNSLSASGIPAGFSVRILATPTFLGKDTILNTGVTPPWRGIGRGFKNLASANATSDPGPDSTTQAAITDRALGVRQTGTFGDSGAAFVFQIANTVAKKNFQLGFKIQSLDTSSPRTTNWIVDYGVGANPTSFTSVATSPDVLPTGNKLFSNTSVSASFGTALDNINDVVWVRILTIKRSTGSGSRATTAIDDWNLSWQELNASVSNIIRDENYLSLSGNLASKLNITFNKAISSVVNLQVLSLNGRVVYQKQISRILQGQNEDVAGLNLSSGVYILKVESKEGIYTTKLVR
jgi:hypothetical protein